MYPFPDLMYVFDVLEQKIIWNSATLTPNQVSQQDIDQWHQLLKPQLNKTASFAAPTAVNGISTNGSSYSAAYLNTTFSVKVSSDKTTARHYQIILLRRR